jgi:hypothetical protein
MPFKIENTVESTSPKKRDRAQKVDSYDMNVALGMLVPTNRSPGRGRPKRPNSQRSRQKNTNDPVVKIDENFKEMRNQGNEPVFQGEFIK